MTVIEKISEINDVIKEIFEFTQRDEKISEDFNEYLRTIGAKNITINQMEKVFLPFYEAANRSRKLFRYRLMNRKQDSTYLL